MKDAIAVVFAGAGASTGVDRQQYPTTLDFYERLPAAIREHNFLKHIRAWMQHAQGGLVVDVEVVLWALEDLATFLKNLSSAKDFPLYALRNDHLTELTSKFQSNPLPSAGKIVHHYPGLLPEIERVRDEINIRVHEFYSELPTTEQLEVNWLPLLQGLRTAGYQLELATTNYDLVMEKALSVLDWPDGPIMGRTDDSLYRYLDLDLWKNPLRQGGLLTKLHGSVDWSYDRSGRIRVGSPDARADKRHAIIYPGFKGSPEQEEMAVFHNYFAQAVSAAQVLVFIGFAFRDDYLNRIISNNLQPGAKVVIINPAHHLPSMPLSSELVVHIRECFDANAVQECLQTVSVANPNPAGERRRAKALRPSNP